MRPKSEIYIPKRDDEHPHPFHIRVPPGVLHYAKPTCQRSVGIRGEMERYFPIKPGQPIGMTLATFYSFSEFLIRKNNRFVKNGTANFGQNIPTEYSNRIRFFFKSCFSWRFEKLGFHCITRMIVTILCTLNFYHSVLK